MKIGPNIYHMNKSGKNINNECPFGRSDHVVLEIEIKGNMEAKHEESFKK